MSNLFLNSCISLDEMHPRRDPGVQFAKLRITPKHSYSLVVTVLTDTKTLKKLKPRRINP
ncbi:MAG: hypothetical protein [Arizlama microvirus]|nr:MAG: hypothetical protein [Arizlama microvirus]